jgi:hypothetical protein
MTGLQREEYENRRDDTKHYFDAKKRNFFPIRGNILSLKHINEF